MKITAQTHHENLRESFVEIFASSKFPLLWKTFPIALLDFSYARWYETENELPPIDWKPFGKDAKVAAENYAACRKYLAGLAAEPTEISKAK